MSHHSPAYNPPGASLLTRNKLSSSPGSPLLAQFLLQFNWPWPSCCALYRPRSFLPPGPLHLQFLLPDALFFRYLHGSFFLSGLSSNVISSESPSNIAPCQVPSPLHCFTHTPCPNLTLFYCHSFGVNLVTQERRLGLGCVCCYIHSTQNSVPRHSVDGQ